MLGGEGNGLLGPWRLQPEFSHDRHGRARIDRQPRANHRAGGVIDLIDQPRGQLDELPHFVVGVRVGLT